MCLRVQYAPRHQIIDPWDRARNLIIIPEDLGATLLFTLRAVRAVLGQLGIPQDHFGALCWCGEDIDLAAATSQRQTEVIQVHTTSQTPAAAGRHHAA